MAPTVGRSPSAAWGEHSSGHYKFGFHGPGPLAGTPDRRAELIDTFRGHFDLPAREAWAEANAILESQGIEWAYQRSTGATVFTARGSC